MSSNCSTPSATLLRHLSISPVVGEPVSGEGPVWGRFRACMRLNSYLVISSYLPWPSLRYSLRCCIDKPFQRSPEQAKNLYHNFNSGRMWNSCPRDLAWRHNRYGGKNSKADAWRPSVRSQAFEWGGVQGKHAPALLITARWDTKYRSNTYQTVRSLESILMRLWMWVVYASSIYDPTSTT